MLVEMVAVLIKDRADCFHAEKAAAKRLSAVVVGDSLKTACLLVGLACTR
jgi:hypothetical protein